MNMRPKTKRRLVILILGLLLLAGAGVGFSLWSKSRLNARLAEAREAGMKAAEAGDYPLALQKLSMYVGKNKTDAEALYTYGEARANVIHPNYRHITEAIGVFSTYLQLKPDDERAMYRLLELYPQAGQNTEMQKLADRMLAKNPRDLKALQAKVTALRHMYQYEEALKSSEQYNEVAPDDLEHQILTMALQLRLNRTPQDVINRAEGLRQAHPDHPRFELLQGIAYLMTGNKEEARKWFRTAAARPELDVEMVSQLVKRLDQVQLFADSQALLERSMAETHSPRIEQLLVQRKWQNGQFGEVIKQLKDLDPASNEADSDLLAYYAMSLYQAKRDSEAQAIVQALGSRTQDKSALAWTDALKAQYAKDIEPKAAIEAYQTALNRDPQNPNPVVQFMLGNAYNQMGETELAIEHWSQAILHAPSWAMPYTMVSQTLIKTGRSTAGLAVAEEAMERVPQPNQFTLRVSQVVAAFARLDASFNISDAEQILKLVEPIQKAAPNEPQTLPIYISLLSRTGRKDEAITKLQAALASPVAESEELMVRLSMLSRAEKLGLEKTILDQLEKRSGLTPTVASARAVEMLTSGKPREGLTYLQTAARETSEPSPKWMLAVAQYREVIRDPGALAAWKELGNAHPRDLQIQSRILQMDSVREDRDFMKQTIDRVKELSGEEALLWKQEEARWLLGSPDKSRDSAQAAAILTEIIRRSPTLSEPRVLLAIAQENLGNIDRAIEQLQAAAERSPDPRISMDAARLLQSAGRFEEAGDYLKRAAKSPMLNPQGREQLALMFEQQGDPNQALNILQQAGGGNNDAARQAMLAELSWQTGNTAEAARRYFNLLERRDLDPKVIHSAAEFFASQDDMEQAQKALQRLNDLSMAPGARELILGQFNERHIGYEAALEQYQKAVQAAPKDTSTWSKLLGFYLRQGRFAETVAAADQAVKAGADNGDIQSLKRHAQALQGIENQPEMRPLIEALANEPQNQAAAEALGILQSARSSGEPPSQTSEKLSQLINRHPQFLPLYSVTIEKYLSNGQVEEAINLSAQANKLFPKHGESARLATHALAAAGKWYEMRQAAEVWREKSLSDPRLADKALAIADINQRKPQEVLNRLNRYLKSAQQQPEQNMEMLSLYARALLMLGQQSEAAALLLPLAKESPTWRAQWLALSSSAPDPASASLWIGQITPLIPPGATPERERLASAWYDIAINHDFPKGFEMSRDTLKPMLAGKDLTASGLLTLASASEMISDTAVAEEAYRRAIEVEPRQHVAMNNLAYLLMKKAGKENLAKAEELAIKATTLLPSNSSYHDTLARIYTQGDKRDLAIQSFNKAISLEPNNVESLIGLAYVLSQNNKPHDAMRILQQVDNLLVGRQLSKELGEELKLTREAVNKALSTAETVQ